MLGNNPGVYMRSKDESGSAVVVSADKTGTNEEPVSAPSAADAMSLKLDAERKLGEILRETPKATGAAGIGKKTSAVSYLATTARRRP